MFKSTPAITMKIIELFFKFKLIKKRHHQNCTYNCTAIESPQNRKNVRKNYF